MPDEALFRVAFHHAFYHLIGREVLLVTADDLDAPMFAVSCEESEILEDVEHHFRSKHARDRSFDMVNLAFIQVFIVAPWPPHINGHTDGAVPEQTTLSSK